MLMFVVKWIVHWVVWIMQSLSHPYPNGCRTTAVNCDFAANFVSAEMFCSMHRGPACRLKFRTFFTSRASTTMKWVHLSSCFACLPTSSWHKELWTDPGKCSETWVCFVSVRVNFTNQIKGIPWLSSEFTESQWGCWKGGYGVMGSHHLCIPQSWYVWWGP